MVSRLLLQALEQNSGIEARFAVLATVEHATAFPRARTIVVREVLSQPLTLIFSTHATSQKVNQGPHGEICWYFHRTREQFRISGSLVFFGEEPLPCTLRSTTPQPPGSYACMREQMWQRLSADTRAQFVGEDELGCLHPPQSFVLGVLEAEAVDHLVLGKPNARTMFLRREGNWDGGTVVECT